jgi:hypothetical protein
MIFDLFPVEPEKMERKSNKQRRRMKQCAVKVFVRRPNNETETDYLLDNQTNRTDVDCNG